MIGKLPEGDRPATTAFQRVRETRPGCRCQQRRPRRRPASEAIGCSTPWRETQRSGAWTTSPQAAWGRQPENLPAKRLPKFGVDQVRPGEQHHVGTAEAVDRLAKRPAGKDVAGTRTAPRRPGARCPGRGPDGGAGRRRPRRSPGSRTARSPRGPPPRGRDSEVADRRAGRPEAPGPRRSPLPAGRRTPG